MQNTVSATTTTEKKESNKSDKSISDRFIEISNKQSMRRSFVNDSFVDDGDIKLVTNRFDKNTYCTVSGVGFVYCFIYLFIYFLTS